MAAEDPHATAAALVERCLKGEKPAWIELVDRYRRLIYSVPVRLGLGPDEADEVFQDVCLKLLRHLESLRDGRSLVRWLVVTTQRRSWDVANERRRYVADDAAGASERVDPRPLGEQVMVETEQEYLVREALQELSGPCRTLIEGLFYADPPLSYADLGKKLGRPHGSLGPTRARCLQSLRKVLDERGFQR